LKLQPKTKLFPRPKSCDYFTTELKHLRVSTNFRPILVLVRDDSKICLNNLLLSEHNNLARNLPNASSVASEAMSHVRAEPVLKLNVIIVEVSNTMSRTAEIRET